MKKTIPRYIIKSLKTSIERKILKQPDKEKTCRVDQKQGEKQVSQLKQCKPEDSQVTSLKQSKNKTVNLEFYIQQNFLSNMKVK